MERDMMKGNITLKQYKEILEKAKSAVLSDLNSSDGLKLRDSEEPSFSVLKITLLCRDYEDRKWVFDYGLHSMFLNFVDVMDYIKDELKRFLVKKDKTLRDKLYWRIEKYTNIKEVMCKMYEVYFSLDCELLGVQWRCSQEHNLFPDSYPDLWRYSRDPEKYIKLSDAQRFLMDSKQQLFEPLNIELPYQTGDILYFDRRPSKKSFYAVYCAETVRDKEEFEQISKEYGFYIREHFCLYIQECGHFDIAALTPGNVFGSECDIQRPYSQFDRIKVVERCDNARLMNASIMLKKSPDFSRTLLAAHYTELDDLIDGKDQ